MKSATFYFSFVLMALFTRITLAALDPVVGVRLLFNRGVADSADASCSDEEQSQIHDALRRATVAAEAASSSQRKLRSSKNVFSRCRLSCKDYDNGTCFMSASHCQNDKDAPSSAPSNTEADAVIINSPEYQAKCSRGVRLIMSVVQQQLKSTELRTTCKSLLQKRLDLQCHLL